MIDILLSTFNGEIYLSQLIESVLGQTHKEWRLFVRDDGSSDSTLQIINDYTIRFPGKIILVEDSEKRLGACQSFARLLSHSKADYTMFCDQDDIWLPEKIELTLRKMRESELEDRNVPFLVHTDLKVVDRNLNVRSESFSGFQHLNPNMKTLNHLLVMNVVTGCTMMMNRKLRGLVPSISEAAIIHDWWIALVASAFGRIEYIDTAIILYRQHSGNEIGAVSYFAKYFVPRIPDLYKAIRLFERIAEQAGSFLTNYRAKLSDEQIEVLNYFSNIFKKGRLERLYILIRFKIFGSGLLRNLGVTMLILLMKRTRDLETTK